MFYVLALLCLVPICEVFGGNNFPPYIHVCKRQGDMFPCLKENAEACRSHLDKGIPELYIPPLAPFKLPKVTLERSGFVFEIEDMVLKGLDTFEILSMAFQLEGGFSVQTVIKLHALQITGTYTLKGKLLMLELNGHGAGEANATDLTATVKIAGSKVTKNGKEHGQVSDGKATLGFEGPIQIYFNNLFGDREDLTKATNEVIQDNIMDFVKELQPVMEDVIMSIVLGIMKPILNKYSLEELFLL